MPHEEQRTLDFITASALILALASIIVVYATLRMNSRNTAANTAEVSRTVETK